MINFAKYLASLCFSLFFIFGTTDNTVGPLRYWVGTFEDFSVVYQLSHFFAISLFGVRSAKK